MQLCIQNILLLAVVFIVYLPSSRQAASTSTCEGSDTHSSLKKIEPASNMLRAVSYNVRRFKAVGSGESTVNAIGDQLAALQPSLVALNEVDVRIRPEALSSLAAKLGAQYEYKFFGHVRGNYGNALISKYPIVSVRETHIKGGTEMALTPGIRKYNGDIAKAGEVHRLARGMLECDVEMPDVGVVTVAVTHLDHISEEQREVQLDHILEVLGPNTSRTLLLGDLNALTRQDYTAEEWTVLEDRNKEQSWTPPAAGCLDALAEAGFTDVFAAAAGVSRLSERRPDADGALPQIFSAHVSNPLYRIDYMFQGDSLVRDLNPTAAYVAVNMTLSDHFPVVFDLKHASSLSRM